MKLAYAINDHLFVKENENSNIVVYRCSKCFAVLAVEKDKVEAALSRYPGCISIAVQVDREKLEKLQPKKKGGCGCGKRRLNR